MTDLQLKLYCLPLMFLVALIGYPLLKLLRHVTAGLIEVAIAVAGLMA